MNANTDQAKTSFDIKKIFDETSPEYKAMISDMDVIAKHLKKMQQDGIPILWRPLHEASGGWFWWGKKYGKDYLKESRLKGARHN